MTLPNDAPDQGAPSPAGLGGWLWPVTWATAVLPVASIASLIAILSGDLLVIFRYGEIPYPLSEPWALRSSGLEVLLTLATWWWAKGWFARDPRVITKSPILLLAFACLLMVIVWVEHDHADYALPAGVLTGLAIAIMLCNRWSQRVRNTFTRPLMPAHATFPQGRVFGGPGDWSRGRWILPGALLYTAFGLFSEWGVFAEAAFQTIPPPRPESMEPGNAAAVLAALGHPGRYIEASRVGLMLSLCAALLLAGAITGLARGARWTPWISIGTLALAMAAPLWMTVRDWCCPFLDGPDFGRMWRGWCVVLILLIIATAFRRWPAKVMRT